MNGHSQAKPVGTGLVLSEQVKVSYAVEQNTPCEVEKLTSMQVFLKFVSRNESGLLVEENILSKECFEAWVLSRFNRLKYPEGAFKRTISSHLRSVDGRSPFPEDVESSILAKYRETDPFGHRVNCFKFLTGTLSRKRPLRSKKHDFYFPYGFHEQKRIKAPATKETKNCNQTETASICSPSRNLKTRTDIYKDLCNLVGIHVEVMEHLAKHAIRNNFPFYPPAVAYLVKVLKKKSHYCSKEFVLPKKHEQVFLKDCTL
eukprot:snap_masked-scaffold_7-processed-gene-4.32-mRNA-1 protein AED:1.00 eAED:1.00 QI:0/0/0/0/1/1/3/0/258